MSEQVDKRLKLAQVNAAEPTTPVASVLVVDDDSIVAESIARYLASLGYAADWTASAAEALDRVTHRAEVAQAPIAVMISDVSMPGMGGLELVRRCKEQCPELVPIVITGFVEIFSPRMFSKTEP